MSYRFLTFRDFAAILTAKLSSQRNRLRTDLTFHKAGRPRKHCCSWSATWLPRVFFINLAWVPTLRSRPNNYCLTSSHIKDETKGGKGESRGVNAVRVWYFNQWLGTASLHSCNRLNTNRFNPRLCYCILEFPCLAMLRSWGWLVILGCSNLYDWITWSSL